MYINRRYSGGKYIPSAEEVFRKLRLQENCLYLVAVQWRADNPLHYSFLFTGFKNGNYCEIYNNDYEKPEDMMNAYLLIKVRYLAKIRSGFIYPIPKKFQFNPIKKKGAKK